jgi:hypothetical protein
MNVFTTDHPMVAQPSCFDAKKNPFVSFCCSAFIIALILCPLFLGVTWLAVHVRESPDVPEPSWTDSIFDVVGLMLSFPADFFAKSHVSLLTRVGFTEGSFSYFGVVVDALFWVFVGVSLYRVLAWYFQKKGFAR